MPWQKPKTDAQHLKITVKIIICNDKKRTDSIHCDAIVKFTDF